MSLKETAPGLYNVLKTAAPVLMPVSHICFVTMILSFCLICTPGALTKYLPTVDNIRNWLLRKLKYYWQLSLEGPLFKVIGRCGKLCCKGRLSSGFLAPKAFKVKVLGGSEFELAWTPQLPDNPFHEENYIISYRSVGEDGKAGEWIERSLHPTDYFKRDKEKGEKAEKPKQIGKAERKRLKIGDLPENTVFHLRVCAAGANGGSRSKWTPEVIARTYAKPSKDMGHKGPLAKNAPTFGKEYTWWQSKHEVGLWIAIPEDWKAKEITVKVTGTDITMQHEKGVLLAGPLGKKVRIDEVDWVIEPAGEHVEKGGKQLALTLRKEKLMELWPSFIADESCHPQIDTAALQLFYPGNSMNELGSPDLWT